VVLALDSTQGGDLRITVRDTGIGMTNDQVSRVFDDFAQADSSTTRRYGGTGLGMGITRRLVEAMDGRLEITSALGQGTEIGLFLPLPLAPDDAVRATAWAELPPRAPDTGVSRAGPKVLRNRDRTIETERLTGMRVLVTDDNATNRKVLSAYLERVGIAVTLASSGQESLDAFAPGLFDAVLMDISMPDMDGPETLDRLRMKEVEARARVAIPVLAVTAHALPDEVTEFLTRGFAGHVAKPIRADDLMSALITIREAGAAHGDAPVEVPGAG
jgi:CheY-like chemotaxis protein